MKPAVRLPALSLLILIVIVSIAYAVSWPMKEAVDLSSGFGDFRNGRFHAGIDLRTGGVTGKRVYAPVSGYVSKIRMSYNGYGKGLYFTGSDGSIYVFGHLSGFASPLEKIVKSRQKKVRRYYVDIDFPADSVKFKQGELLAFSGQTGAGAPHLHFEKRTADNRPLNPLSHGFPIKDKVKPFFTRVGFEQTDDRTLFLNGQRRMFLDVSSQGKGRYQLDTVLYFNAPFGVLADCFDRMRAGGMRQAVHRLGLYVDGQLYFRVTMDTIDYNTTKSADLLYDFSEAADGEPRVRRLYHREGNDYAGTDTSGVDKGMVGLDGELTVGLHRGRILAEDAFGNQSELSFQFYWGPQGDLYTLDSSVVKSDSNTVYFFTPHPDVKDLRLDRVVVQLNRGENWGVPPGIDATLQPNGKVTVSVFGSSLERQTLRLVAITRDSCAIFHMPFSGFQGSNFKPSSVRHELTEDGLIVVGELRALLSYRMQAELYYQDSLLGIEPMSTFFNMLQYRIFVPARPAYQRIDKVVMRMIGDKRERANEGEQTIIVQIGRDSLQVAIDEWCTVTADPQVVYEPRFIELKRNRIQNRVPLNLNSDHYEILPENVLLKHGIHVTVNVQPDNPYLAKTGLNRLDREANRWEWIANPGGKPSYTASSSRGGSFALVYDMEPPVISDISVFDNETIRNLQPTITFKLKDNLSGIEDDRNFTITIDDDWQIPEFDPERGVCSITPVAPLTKGAHSLKIDIRDRVGNRTFKYVSFSVVPAPKSKKGT